MGLCGQMTRLTSRKTWEKAIYHLLIKYRNKHLENYNMDDEEDEEARARRQARRERDGRSAASPAKRKGSTAVTPRLTPLSENETIQDRPSSPVARPSAPTPKKAAGPVKVHVSPEGRQLGVPNGPRPAAPNRASYASSNDSHMTPSIVLQEATPTKDYVGHVGAPSRPRSIEPPASPLNVPTVQDEQLQHFFNEVANQLNTMNIRSSVASNSSTATSTGLGADIHAYMAYANGVSATGSAPISPVMEYGDLETMDPNQFADADDDETELASEYSHAPSSIHTPMLNQQGSLIGLGFGQPPVQARPGLYPVSPSPNPSNNPHRWSYASSAGSTRYPAESPSPQMYNAGPWSPQSEHAPVLQAHRAAPPPPPRTTNRIPPPPLARPVSVSQTSSVSQTGESLLTRDESYVVIDNADVPASDSSWGSRQSGFSAHRNAQDAFGMLKKRKKVTIDPVPYSSELSGPASAISNFSAMSSSSASASASSPKRSWFNNLFSFKPPSCTVLSHDNVANTRERTRMALHDMGVRVALVDIDGVRGLKCRLDEVRDPQGNTTVVKGVRFKVEFTRSTVSSAPGSNTLVSLTLEKGAQSAFKSIFNSLRTVLEFNQPFASQQQQQQQKQQQQQQAQYSQQSQYRPHSSAPPASTRPPPTPTQSHQYSYNGSSTAAPQTSYRYPHSTNTSPNNTLSAPPNRYGHSAPSSPAMPTTPRFNASPQMPVSPQLQSGIRM